MYNNHEYLNKLEKFASVNRLGQNTYELSRKCEWYIPKKILENEISSKNWDFIEFIWFAMNLNLVSKSVFMFSPSNYTYCQNYLEWKTKNKFPKLFNYIYTNKFKHLIDLRHLTISESSINIFNSFSTPRLSEFANDFIFYLKELDEKACYGLISNVDFLKNIIQDRGFVEEFSSEVDDISNQYFKLLNYKISKL